MVGQKDFNVPLAGSEQMYQALRSLGVDTQLVIYPRQFHGITIPSYRIDRLQRYLDWYAKYLKTPAGHVGGEGLAPLGLVHVRPDPVLGGADRIVRLALIVDARGVGVALIRTVGGAIALRPRRCARRCRARHAPPVSADLVAYNSLNMERTFAIIKPDAVKSRLHRPDHSAHRRGRIHYPCHADAPSHHQRGGRILRRPPRASRSSAA